MTTAAHAARHAAIAANDPFARHSARHAAIARALAKTAAADKAPAPAPAKQDDDYYSSSIKPGHFDRLIRRRIFRTPRRSGSFRRSMA